MTSAAYRKILADTTENHRLANFLQLEPNIDIQFLQSCLSDPNFSKNASIEDLYRFKKYMGFLSFRINTIQGQIDARDLAPSGEFEDKVIEFDDLGIGTRTFECVNPFVDIHAQMDILPGTFFEVDRLSYANAGNGVTGFYKNLTTNHTSKKLVAIFANGQETILSLKILELYFKPV